MPTIEIRIFDPDKKDPRLLIPLSALLEHMVSAGVQGIEHDWKIFRGASGYGKFVCEIERRLQEQQYTRVPGSTLLPVLLDGGEYFNNVHIRLTAGELEFGVCDSTYLFARGPNEIVSTLARGFHKVEFVRI